MDFKRKYFVVAMACLLMGFLIVTVFQDWGFIRGFLGDVLVVVFLYCLAKSVYAFKSVPLAIGIWLFALATEVSQYFKLANKLQWHNKLSEILLGSTFDFWDIIAYTIGAVLVYWVDERTM